MKQTLSVPNIVLFIGLISCLITACTAQAKAQGDNSTSTLHVQDNANAPVSESVDEAKRTTPLSYLQTEVVNDVAITVANFRFEQNQLMIDTCLDLPDNGDWTIWEVTLKLGDQEMKGSGGFPMETPIENSSQKEQRCDTIYFDELTANTDFSNASFIVEWILAYPREGEECSPDYLAKYQEALNELNTEITVECFIEELDGGGMSGIRVASKPDTMSQEEAEALIYNYDFFLELYGIQGPWVFPFSLEQ